MFIPVWLLVVLFVLVCVDNGFRASRFARRERMILDQLKSAQHERDHYLAQLTRWGSHDDY